MSVSQRILLEKLQREILPLQGYKPLGKNPVHIGCPGIESAFPGKVFPTGAMHEFVVHNMEDTTACSGFIAGLSSALLQKGGVLVWISSARTIFPAAIAQFNIDPSHIIFIDVKKEQQVLWATEEVLKCNGVTAVVSDIRDLNFTHSRRFQLAVEQSRVTGFLLHHHKKTLGVNACVARWRIHSIPSIIDDNLSGVGFPRWNVELLKARNGKPGNWIIEWNSHQLQEITTTMTQENAEYIIDELRKNVG